MPVSRNTVFLDCPASLIKQRCTHVLQWPGKVLSDPLCQPGRDIEFTYRKKATTESECRPRQVLIHEQPYDSPTGRCRLGVSLVAMRKLCLFAFFQEKIPAMYQQFGTLDRSEQAITSRGLPSRPELSADSYTPEWIEHHR